MLNSEKCTDFDNGFCKDKDQCLNKHTTTDCKGECHDKRTFPFQHRTTCKNGNKCIFLSSKACEFLHEDILPENNRVVSNIEVSITKIKASV